MELSPYVLIFVLMIFYIILGMFLDGISAVVLTMAIIEPMIRQAGFDMIWFGIFLVIVVEMAQITPPVGFNLFVLQGMANKDMGYIAKKYFLLMVIALFLLFDQHYGCLNKCNINCYFSRKYLCGYSRTNGFF